MNTYHMSKINMTFGIWFSAFALLVLIIDAGMFISWLDFKKDSISTDAVIIGIRSSYDSSDDSENHSVLVEYIVDGEVYRRSPGYYSSSMRTGQHITVYYDRSDPSRIKSDPSSACALMLIFIFVFGGVGAAFLIYELRLKKTVTALIAEGKYIVCDSSVERVEVSAHVKVNRVYYRQTDFFYNAPDGKEYIFSSRPYHPDKNPFIDGQNVIVYVDIEKDPKKYYVSEDN
ncbi:MAG: DUF3592 domain-containing protein [Oscillospiraceae bacterium]|nr:DUF3592 domain-containing protein [Oscillospiraceae bacterium]